MGLIVILPLGVLAGWSIFAIFRWLRRGNYGPEWRRAYGLLAGTGLLLGLWFGFFLNYRLPTARIYGFPIPVHFAVLDKSAPPGQYVESSIPLPIRCAAAIADVLSGVALCLAPIAVAAFFKENKIQRDEHGNPILRHP